MVSLSRNFGKEAALLAGLDHARLGAVLFIDGDGQHPPALIETLVGHWLDDGYDVVYTAKAHRANESLAAPRRREGVLSAAQLGRAPQNSGGCRRLPPAVAARGRVRCGRCRSATASSKGWRAGSAFARCAIDYEPAPRAKAAAPGTLRSLIGLSINGLTSFSVAPLRIATMLGLLLALDRAALWRRRSSIETLVYGVDVPGYPSLFVGVMVLGGVQLIMLGVVGEYIGKILSEIKGRPVYFVAEHEVKSDEESRADEHHPQTPHAPAGKVGEAAE